VGFPSPDFETSLPTRSTNSLHDFLGRGSSEVHLLVLLFPRGLVALPPSTGSSRVLLVAGAWREGRLTRLVVAM